MNVLLRFKFINSPRLDPLTDHYFHKTILHFLELEICRDTTSLEIGKTGSLFDYCPHIIIPYMYTSNT